MIIKTVEDINEYIEFFKAHHYKMGFTNGCFDIIHSGHIQYLKEAKEKCDFLIIGLNSDVSVKKIKGESHPINRQEDRAIVLEAFEMVDCVIIFDEETPYKLISIIKPDILIKGGDWEIKNIIGSDIVLKNGGEVLSLEYKDGYSTTSIIDKIEENYTEERKKGGDSEANR